MKYIVSNVKIPFELGENALESILSKKMGVPVGRFSFAIQRRSLDCRRNEGFWVYRLIVDVDADLRGKDITEYLPSAPISMPRKKLSFRPVVVGFGPAGLFVSLILARSGNPPIILERGKAVEDRAKDIDGFLRGGRLNPESNVCYGEGGAGAWSDGKLNTGIKSPYIQFVLDEFVSHGASKDILIDAKPHIGSDILPGVLKSFRAELLGLGTDILFSSRFTGIKEEGTGLRVFYESDGIGRSLFTEACILAYGHSPFDTAEALQRNGLLYAPKDFSIGLRVEFPQRAIDEVNYRENYGKTLLPPSTFQSVCHLSGGRSIYTFCMCPGGKVLNSSTEPMTVVTNGASQHERDGRNGNAALLVTLRTGDYFKGDPLDGYRYRSHFEHRAYRDEHPYFAPVNKLSSFLSDSMCESFGSVTPSYLPGVYPSDFRDSLPDFALKSLREGISLLRQTQPLYRYGDAVLTGIETRSSSPVRIPRNDMFESNIHGLFPIGEGASYAGGITSAAVDGVRCAMGLLKDRF